MGGVAGWRRNLGWHIGTRVAAALLLGFILIPIGALIIGTNASGFMAGLRHPLVGPALRLSMLTTLTSLTIIVLLGTPLAWLLARPKGRILRWAELAIQLPVVLPPAVAGVALLFAFGRRGLIGAWLDRMDIQVPFTTAAVVMAEVFVAAPFFIQGAVAAFERLDRNLIRVARTLGASPGRVFFRIALPLSAPGLISGAALSWARALGEFGATLMFAGNLTGRTQTLPLAIYTAMESDLRAAQALSIVLVSVAFGLLWAVRGGASQLIGREIGASRGRAGDFPVERA
jgi:molybdate transport system permease protein